MISVEFVEFPGASDRARATLQALAAQAPADVVTCSPAFVGGSDWLVFWGPGGANRKPAMQRQEAAGGHSLAIDLAYWDRYRKVRVSIDAPHPQAWVMRQDWPASRLVADRVTLESRWNPKGPVIVAGIGWKARQQYGDAVPAWEAAMIAACQARGWPVQYRRKQVDAPAPAGVPITSSAAPIEVVLSGASLVVTWHSNVAVDAIRLGIPVVCRDGAAAALCPAALPDVVTPLPLEVRRRFLQNLAWFQWDMKTEAAACWAWLQELLLGEAVVIRPCA